MSFLNPFHIDIFELVVFLVEFIPYIIVVVVILATLFLTAARSKGTSIYARGKSLLLVLFVAVSTMITGTFLGSWEYAYRYGYSL